MPLPEKALIAKIRRQSSSSRHRQRGISNSKVLHGIGDDCAVLRLPPGHDSLITTDFSLEGVHFRRDWHPPESVGHRCLARGLSDIAAMGGEPVAAFLSLALPRGVPKVWVDGFMRGLIRLAKKYGVELAGGDTAESRNGVLADIVVFGSVPKGKAILRSGARPGDRIYVSGELGGSTAALTQMRSKPRQKLNPREYVRHFYPDPRVELGKALRQLGLATAMIDLSDGLSTDLAHICEESGVGAEVAADLVPRARVGKPAREVSLDLALHGGEDYELLFTAPRGKRVPSRIAGAPLTQIGVISKSSAPTVLLRDGKGLSHKLGPGGWEHFRK